MYIPTVACLKLFFASTCREKLLQMGAAGWAFLHK